VAPTGWPRPPAKAPQPGATAPQHRDEGARGVCGGVARTTGIDVTFVRIGFVLLTLGSGIGILVYALAWLFVPLEDEPTNIFSRALSDRRGIRLVIAIIPAFVLVRSSPPA